MSLKKSLKRTVLVVGSGGREHALAWKLSASPQVGRVIVAPGNDAWPKIWERWAQVNLKDRAGFDQLAEKALSAQVDLAVIGPDNPLALGIVDVLTEKGILTFGPTAEAARLEASKGFAKEVMKAAGVPTAEFVLAHNLEELRALLKSAKKKEPSCPEWLKEDRGVVLKLDGLALGKGVRVCASLDEALDAIAPGEELSDLAPVNAAWVVEERLRGEEISWLALCDGTRVALLDPARDYKRVGTGNRGLNTGGMGAFSPLPGNSKKLEQQVRSQVFEPVLKEMNRRGIPFQGVLYAGLMWDREQGKYWVLEFNARFGDPETQVLMARMKDDLFEWCEACAQGDLSRLGSRVKFSNRAAVVVVGAAQGYPQKVETGSVLRTPRDYGNSFSEPTYFWAGVKAQQKKLEVAGGRVVGAMGVSKTLKGARTLAYRRLQAIQFEGMHYREDIALIEQGSKTKETLSIAVLASGRGSNFEAIAQAIRTKRLDAKIECVISDREDALVLRKARKLKIPAFCVPVPKAENGKALQERQILKILRQFEPKFLILAGYMRIVGKGLLQEFKSPRGYFRVVNIHPSLLPAFPGVGSYEKAFQYGTKVTGVTVHLVDEGLDSGPICAQQAFEIDDCKTVAQVEKRGLAIEHALFPHALRWILTEDFEVTQMGQPGRYCVRPN